MPHSPDELKALAEDELERLDLWHELHGQAESARYGLVKVGGKRVRPVIALAVGEALGAPLDQVMPAALAIELVHNFSLVHDDLPGLDNDEERRGKPSVWARVRRRHRGARRRRAPRRGVPARLPVPVLRRRARARAGDARDDRRPVPRHDGAGGRPRRRPSPEDRAASSSRRWRWRSGRRSVPLADQEPWRAFAEELGLLFQIVDDILDGDGYVRCTASTAPTAESRGPPAARRGGRHERAPRDRRRPRGT